MRILITILSLMMLAGCTAMLVGADVQPTEQGENDRDEKSKKER